MSTVTEANRPQAIYRVRLEEGEKVCVNLADYDYVFVYHYLPSPTNKV